MKWLMSDDWEEDEASSFSLGWKTSVPTPSTIRARKSGTARSASTSSSCHRNRIGCAARSEAIRRRRPQNMYGSPMGRQKSSTARDCCKSSLIAGDSAVCDRWTERHKEQAKTDDGAQDEG